ncbi:hypothetical protein VTP01DRAFT_10209 [Rhizomucor pusillus]|uniref:uncharacterized protein n=1 Tax=Rhizomucor pusillus TaxID=4840 RepID=UPI003743AC2E
MIEARKAREIKAKTAKTGKNLRFLRLDEEEMMKEQIMALLDMGADRSFLVLNFVKGNKLPIVAVNHRTVTLTAGDANIGKDITIKRYGEVHNIQMRNSSNYRIRPHCGIQVFHGLCLLLLSHDKHNRHHTHFQIGHWHHGLLEHRSERQKVEETPVAPGYKPNESPAGSKNEQLQLHIAMIWLEDKTIEIASKPNNDGTSIDVST